MKSDGASGGLSRVVTTVLAIAAVITAIFVGYLLGVAEDGGSDSVLAVPRDPLGDPVDGAPVGSPIIAAPINAGETTIPPTTDAETTTTIATTTTTAPPADESAPTDSARPDGFATFKGGKVYLEGAVPSQEIADLIVARVEALIGPGNVVVNYVIDPTANLPEAGPLYIEDLVLFDTSSAAIAPDFLPLLDLSLSLLTQTPTVTVTVVGHTDSLGSDADNLALSRRRVDAVLGYWIDRGIDPSRLTADPRGESNPLADNTTVEGQQTNRRVEFIVEGFLG